MPPRSSILSVFRTLSIRPSPASLQRAQQPCPIAQIRYLTSDTRGTPQDNGVSDVLRNKMEAFGQSIQKEAPAETEAEAEHRTANERALHQLKMAAYGIQTFSPEVEGHKFGVPELPIARDMNHKTRYDSLITQCTKLLMRDGKLAKAQRDMAMILNHLRSSPPPKLNPARPLLPGAPPASQLPLDPVLYLSLAVDSVAPLVRMRPYKGLGGGGRSLDIPIPLAQRQRRRMAMGWILDVVNKKPSRGSGRAMFPTRVAEEIIAVVEGRSSVWEKRQLLHKLGTATRANLNSSKLQGMRLG